MLAIYQRLAPAYQRLRNAWKHLYRFSNIFVAHVDGAVFAQRGHYGFASGFVDMNKDELA